MNKLINLYMAINPWQTALEQPLKTTVVKPTVVPPVTEQVTVQPKTVSAPVYKRAATPVITPSTVSTYSNPDASAAAASGNVLLADRIQRGIATTPATTPTTPASSDTTGTTVADMTTYARTPSLSEQYYSGTANKSIDEASIREQEMARIQQQVDAINAVYASELAKAQTEGQRAVQQQQAISTVRGGAGSDFARAEQSNVEAANQQVYNAIQAEKAAKIAEVQTQGQQRADKKILQAKAEQEAARQAMLTGQKEKTAQLQTYVSNLAQSGVAYENLDNATKNLLREQYGTDANARSVYGSLGVAGAETKEIDGVLYEKQIDGTWKAVTEKQEKPETTPSSYREWELAGGEAGTGQTYAQYIKKTTGSDLTPYQKFQATQSIAKDNQTRSEQAREMARQATLIQNSYDNILKGGDRSLNTQAIITSFNKILDPTSVVRESEYDRTAEGQSLINRLQGKYDNIITGGAGVTEATLKEAKEIADKYITGAKSSIAAQNRRAQEMARQFGLNEEFVTNTYDASGVGTVPANLEDVDWANL